MGRRFSSQFKPKKQHVSFERWDKHEKIEKKIQEPDDSYEDHYDIYWRFAQKRKTSKSTDSISTKKSAHSALTRFSTKNQLNGHLIVIKIQKWGYGTSLPLNIVDSNQKKKVNYKRGPYKDRKKNLNDYLDFHSKIIQLLKLNKQNWWLFFCEKSSFKWVVDSHHGSKVRLWNITRKNIVESSRKKKYTN